VLKPDGDGFTVHYDLKLGVPIKAMTPQLTAASERRCGSSTIRSSVQHF